MNIAEGTKDSEFVPLLLSFISYKMKEEKQCTSIPSRKMIYIMLAWNQTVAYWKTPARIAKRTILVFWPIFS